MAKDRKELVAGTEGGDTNCYFPQILERQLVGHNHCSLAMSTCRKHGQKANWELVRVHGLSLIIYIPGKFRLFPTVKTERMVHHLPTHRLYKDHICESTLG